MKPIIMIVVYILLAVIGARLTDRCVRRLTKRAKKIRPFWLIPFILLMALPLAGAFLPDSPARNACQAYGNIWLGFYIYYLGILIILMILRGIFRRRRRGWYAAILILSVIAAAGICRYGMIHAQQPETVSYQITLPNQAAGTDEMKMVLIGDLHLGVNSELAATERMVELINSEEPDVVVVAGDVFTSTYSGLSNPEEYARVLMGIQSKYGVYAVYGNHDVEEKLLGGFALSPASEAFRSPEMEAFFADCGFITLEDKTVLLPCNVQLAGRVDGEKAGDGTSDRMSPEELLAGANPNLPVIVLEHEPLEFQALAEAGADVILCGHTHNGQIFPGNLIVPHLAENAWGLSRLHGADTIVTAGVGCYGPPMRIGTDSEVSVIHVSFQQREEDASGWTAGKN